MKENNIEKLVGGHLRDGEQTDGEYDAHHLEGGYDGHGDDRFGWRRDT